VLESNTRALPQWDLASRTCRGGERLRMRRPWNYTCCRGAREKKRYCGRPWAEANFILERWVNVATPLTVVRAVAGRGGGSTQKGRGRKTSSRPDQTTAVLLPVACILPKSRRHEKILDSAGGYRRCANKNDILSGGFFLERKGGCPGSAQTEGGEGIGVPPPLLDLFWSP